MESLAEYVGNLPNLSGREAAVAAALRVRAKNVFTPGPIDFSRIQSACAIALHMHQPLIPAGGADLQTAALISNLQYMMENQHIADNHNAPAFHRCYRRMGELIPALLREGKQPRIMLEYSGTLLHGLRAMGLDDVFEALRSIALDPAHRFAVEWLGAPWGHAVAPSTPVQDYRLHVRAWQHHFAAIFGFEALGRVRGFSPSEMALPNHPDVAHEFVKTLLDAGYEWVLVQEHSVECPDTGAGPERKHVPHRLVCRSSAGDEVSIIAIIKTQGSDTKLVGQMQPYYEANGLSRWELASRQIPPLVTQIADGENGGVMMNEFPPKFMEVVGRRAELRRRWSTSPSISNTCSGSASARTTCRRSSRSTRSGSGTATGPAPGRSGSTRSSRTSSARTAASTLRVAAGPTTSHGCAATSPCWTPCSRRAHSSTGRRSPQVSPATSTGSAMRSSTCSRRRRAATATGARGCGPTTAANCAGGPRRSCSTTSDHRAE